MNVTPKVHHPELAVKDLRHKCGVTVRRSLASLEMTWTLQINSRIFYVGQT